jgi:prepilin-type N-terminal cleavage/methylation domain-containing protein
MLYSKIEHNGGAMGSVTTGTRRGGFSLVELMIAMSVIAFSIFGVMSMVLHTSATREATRELELAREAASSKIDEIKSMSFADLATKYPSPAKATIAFNVPTLVHQSGSGVAVGVATLDTSNADLYDVLVTVTWKSVRRGASTYSIRSLYAR